jgi:ATP-dependent RNA helicase RhlE
MSFSDLGLLPELLRAVADKGYDTPPPFSCRPFPPCSVAATCSPAADRHRQDRRLRAAHFAAPRGRPGAARSRAPRALVLTPTRELAAQVAQSARDYGKYLQLRTYQVFGGVSINPQISALRSGCDMLVATPGRLLDLAQQRALDLSKVQVLVLDEADRMLDMGFINDIRRVIKLLPQKRQNLLFSATYSDDIRGLAERLLHNPLSIQVAPRNAPIELVEQRAYRVQKEQKRHLLVHLIAGRQWRQVLDFHAHQAWRESSDAAVGGPASMPRPFTATRARLRASRRSTCSSAARYRAGGDGSRRARPRHQGAAAGRQLRTAQCARRLRASHRPHRARRRRG